MRNNSPTTWYQSLFLSSPFTPSRENPCHWLSSSNSKLPIPASHFFISIASPSFPTMSAFHMCVLLRASVALRLFLSCVLPSVSVNSWASSVPPILSSNSKPVSTLISPSRPTSNSHRSYQPLPQGGLYSYTVEAWRSSDTEQFVPTPKRATSQNWARFCHLPRTVPTQFPVLVELKLIQ